MKKIGAIILALGLIACFAGCKMSVDDPVISKIEITVQPAKTGYFVGEALDLTGLKVSAIYSDGKKTDVTKDVKVSGFNSSEAADSQTVTVTYEGKTATFTVKITAVEVTKIELESEPAKKEYFVGDSIDLTGIKVTATYNNGTTADVTASVTPDFDSSTAAESKTVTVTYGGKTVTFTVKIKAIELTGIAVTTQPAKTEYCIDEALDKTGLIVTATYNNGKTEDVTASVTTDFDSSTAAESKTVTVTYGGKTATFTVKIKALEVTKIELTSEPAKKEYFVGETLDLTGLKVTATYNNGKTEDITASVTTDFDSSTAAESKTVTVTYSGKTASFTVKITEVVVTKIDIITQPTKTEYFVGDTIDLTGLKVTATYNNGKTEDVTASVTTDFDSSTAAESKTVTVTYGGKTATFTVKIIAVEVTKIELKSQPTKKEYFVGDAIDLTDLIVTATYNNGKTEDVTASVTTDFDSSTAAESKTVTVTYSGKTATFTVKIKAIELTGIAVTTQPAQKKYCIEEALDLTGIKVTATYNNGTTADVTSLVELSGFNSSAAVDSQTVTVTYSGKTATFTVTIKDMKKMTVNEFITALGTAVETITYDTTKPAGVTLSTDGKTASVYDVKLSGEFYNYQFPTTLVTADLRGLDTSGVTNMSYMFNQCKSLTSLDVSSFDTSKVTNMRNMFYNCTSLTGLDVSSFDTSKVTNMYGMFSACTSLTSLDVSSFDTSSVTNMSWMFYGCSKLTSLDLSSFNTSMVTDMSIMFHWCKSLTSLDLSSFDTSKVTVMYSMFNYCPSLTSLDLSSFDTSSVKSMRDMFNGCSKLTSLDLSSFDTSAVTSKDSMFQSCGTSAVPLAVTYGSGWTLGTSATLLGATNLSFTLKQ